MITQLARARRVIAALRRDPFQCWAPDIRITGSSLCFFIAFVPHFVFYHSHTHVLPASHSSTREFVVGSSPRWWMRRSCVSASSPRTKAWLRRRSSDQTCREVCMLIYSSANLLPVILASLHILRKLTAKCPRAADHAMRYRKTKERKREDKERRNTRLSNSSNTRHDRQCAAMLSSASAPCCLCSALYQLGILLYFLTLSISFSFLSLLSSSGSSSRATR
jgi:hypothetical protein